MIPDKNRIFDGWLSLEGGVDAGRAPFQIGLNQSVSAENMTFRGGTAAVRPGFRILNEVFTNPFQICYPANVPGHIEGEYGGENVDPVYQNQEAQVVYRTGNMQCATTFSPHNLSEDCIMALIAGSNHRC